MKYCQKWRDKKRLEQGRARQRHPRYPGVVPLTAPGAGADGPGADVADVCPSSPLPGGMEGEEGRGQVDSSLELASAGSVAEGYQDHASDAEASDTHSVTHDDEDPGQGGDNSSLGGTSVEDELDADSGSAYSAFGDSGSEEEELGGRAGNSSEDRLKLLRKRLNTFYNSLIINHHLSEAACQRVHDFFLAHSKELSVLSEEGMKVPRSVHHLRRTVKKKTPNIRTTVYLRRSEGMSRGGVHIETQYCAGDFSEVPAEISQNEGVRMSSYAKLRDVLSLAKENHRHLGWTAADFQDVDLCVDGVPEGKSCPNKFVVLTLIWPHCETPYLYRVHSVRHGCPPSANELLLGFADELQECGLRLRLLRCDAVERHHLLNMVQPNGLSSCPWCLEKGTRAYNRRVTMYPADRGAAVRGIPYSSEARTHAHNLQLADEAEGRDGADNEKGIFGHSPLSKIPDFDTVKKVVLELMHALYEGATKRILTSGVDAEGDGDSFEAVLLNKLLEGCRRWSEWPRSPRKLDVPRYKASDFFFLLNHVGPALSLENGVFRRSRQVSFDVYHYIHIYNMCQCRNISLQKPAHYLGLNVLPCQSRGTSAGTFRGNRRVHRPSGAEHETKLHNR